MTEIYDTIIIGGGPAGITAGIYAARKRLKTLLITKDLWGQISKARQVDNWPGDATISGLDLMKKLEKHLRFFLSEIISGETVSLVSAAPLSSLNKQNFSVRTISGKEFLAKTVIVAVGREEKHLNIPGEKEFYGRGVSFCSICDAPFFHDKQVAVAGGGNSAFDAALDLAEYAKTVFIIVNTDRFYADESLQEALRGYNNIKFFLNTEIKEIRGVEAVKEVILLDIPSGKISAMPFDGIFVSIGYQPATNFLGALVNKNESGEVIVDAKNCATSFPGLFAAGDVNDGQWKQFVIAAGEGAKAALSAYQYLQTPK